MAHPNQGALSDADPDRALDVLRSGGSLADLAKTLGVSRIAVRAWLLREDREQYADAITMALSQRIAEADEMLEQASDAVNIARARETARFSRMDYERRRPHLYGQRPSTQVNVAGAGLTVHVVAFSQQLADAASPQLTLDAEDDAGE